MSLTQEQLQTLGRVMAAREDELLSAAPEHAEQTRENSVPKIAGAVGDLADQALADLVRDTENAALSRDIRELREIEAARARMEAGTYGVCADCGLEIAFERLLIQPTALRCVRCQSYFERTHAPADQQPSSSFTPSL